jgi:hypothetical protein
MKRIVLAAALMVMVIAASASAAPKHTLKMFDARSAAEGVALDFALDHKLDSHSVGRCQRRTSRKVSCAATVSGETAAASRTCDLRIVVRAVYRSFYWAEAAGIVSRNCEDITKPLLSYPEARAALQSEADRFAGQATTITYMFRRDDVTFSGRAEWSRPRVPPSKYLPIENCSVSLVATLTDSIAVTNDGFNCY